MFLILVIGAWVLKRNETFPLGTVVSFSRGLEKTQLGGIARDNADASSPVTEREIMSPGITNVSVCF